jgi:hypothetical protein
VILKFVRSSGGGSGARLVRYLTETKYERSRTHASGVDLASGDALRVARNVPGLLATNEPTRDMARFASIALDFARLPLAIAARAARAAPRPLVRRELPADRQPVVLRGDPELTALLADTSTRRYRLTHGVLSFAPDEKVTPELEQKLMDSFEAHAFPGLDPEQYSILWVRHRDKARGGQVRQELHFAVPMVELRSGKQLNIAPPGHARYYEPWKQAAVARHADQLVDPRDPLRASTVKAPARRGRERMSEGIDRLVIAGIGRGEIASRVDVVAVLKGAGYDVRRQGADYISVKAPDTEKPTRLRGDWYSKAFTSVPSIREAIERRQREYAAATRDAGRLAEARAAALADARAARWRTIYPQQETTPRWRPSAVAPPTTLPAPPPPAKPERAIVDRAAEHRERFRDLFKGPAKPKGHGRGGGHER